jgi:hypothetical protein
MHLIGDRHYVLVKHADMVKKIAGLEEKKRVVSVEGVDL